jgi:O-acetylhomoserine (thiol)-lyase
MKPETLALHGGSWRADPATGAVAVPIYQTTSFQFRDAEHARRLFALEELGYTYTRTINPGREVLERRLAALEGGKAALAVASGAAALLYAVLNLAEAGDNVVVPAGFAAAEGAGLIQALLRFGIDVRVVDGPPDEFAHATSARTRAYVAASVSGAELELLPTKVIAEVGRGFNVPLIIDNSAAPLSLRPLADGAAVVVYGAEALGGGAEGGIVIDGGNFSWEVDRLPSLNRPDPSYHGTVWTQVVKRWNASPFIASLRGRFLRDFGGCISPFDVTQLVLAVETLPLRVRRYEETASVLADTLAGHPGIASVARPCGRHLIIKLAGAGSARVVLANLRLIGTKPSTVTTSALEPAVGTLVLSVGLEHPDDLVNDLMRALG